MIYKLDFVKGIRKFVKDDLYFHFSEQFKITKETDSLIIIETDVQDIDAFRILRTVLHVSLIEDDRVVVERNLFRKEWRKNLVPAGINPTLSYVICKVAELKETDIVMDPFCGGGTIVITANLDFKVKKFLASDISSTAVEYTKKNILEAKITKDKYTLFINDVKRLHLQKDYLDKIITNMPFGIREGKHDSNINLYKSFINFSYSTLKKEGLLVAFTTEKTLIEQNIKGKFELIDEIKITQGGLYPSIFVLKKL